MSLPSRSPGRRSTRRADVYSLGCVLYECLVGEPPFRRDSELAVVFAHLDAEPPTGAPRGRAIRRARRGDRAGAGEGPGAALSTCRELARAALAVAVDEASRRLVDAASRAAAGKSDLERGRGRAGREGDRSAACARARRGPRRSCHPGPRGGGWRSAHSRASRASSRSTPTTSSVASGSSPSSSPASSARASSASSALRQRQVVGPSRGSPAGARRRGAPGQRGPGGACYCVPASDRLRSSRRVLVSGAQDPLAEALDALPRTVASCSPSTSSRSCSRRVAPTLSAPRSPRR